MTNLDELDKPTYLRQNRSLNLEDLSKLADNPAARVKASAQPKLLAEENQRLKETLSDLLASATHNQNTQDKFSELELYFLESQSYESLLYRILVDLQEKLQLAEVNLYLVDVEGEICQLIKEIYGELEFPNLRYLNSSKPIDKLYSGSVSSLLSQDKKLIVQLFGPLSEQTKSAALLPLHRGKEVIGSLHLGSHDKNRFHSGLASHFLEHLASIISVCIENSINQERFKHLSLVDLLTRAKNRRYFFQTIPKEIARSSRSMKPLSCLFADIDFFKKVNDERGHLVGDRALKRVASCIQPLLRRSDILARFGGEEFTILLPSCNIEQAKIIAERIRQQVEELNIIDDQENTFKLTVSIGISCWQPDDQHFKNASEVQNYIIGQADKGVYQAKSDGRNCVRIAD